MIFIITTIYMDRQLKLVTVCPQSQTGGAGPFQIMIMHCKLLLKEKKGQIMKLSEMESARNM